MRISYSGIESFVSCPAKYKYQYIDRIKTSKSKEAVFGTLIHECLKYYHNTSNSAPVIEDNLLRYFTEKWNSDIYHDKQEEAFAFHQGIEMLKNYHANNYNLDITIIDLETLISIPMEDHQITGRVDRIDKLSDSFEIIDYKTAKKMPAQEAIDNNLQLSIYCLGLLNRWPSIEKQNKPIKLSLYYVRHGEKLSTYRNKTQLQESREKILDLINQIKKSSFEPKSNPLCNWCQYQSYCPLFRHKFFSQQSPAPDQQKIKNIINKYFKIKDRQKIDSQKLIKLKNSINQYCDENKLERIFSNNYCITRLSQQRFSYDSSKVKEILEPLNKWQEILIINNTKLRKVINSLPLHIQKEINNTKILDKEFKVLTTSETSRI